MTVVVSCATAAALLAEGAICLDADVDVATQEGRVVSLAALGADGVPPILVCGSPTAVDRALEGLEADGWPAWRVDGRTECCRLREGPP